MKMANCLYHSNKKSTCWSGHVHLFPKWGGKPVEIMAGYCSSKCSNWDLMDAGNLGDCEGCCGYRESVEISL